MRLYTLRALAARVPRAGLTLLVVAVAVAAVTGSLIFTGTIRASFEQLFSGSLQGAQLTVTGREAIASDPSAPPSMPAGLVPQIRHQAGVAAADGQVVDTATIVGRDGRPLTGGRLPTLALSLLPPPFTGLRLLTGGAPHGPGEVVLDQATAARQGLRVGDSVAVLTGQPARRFRVAGIATLGSAALGGQPFVVFDLPTAQALFDKGGSVDQIDIAALPGYPLSTVRQEVRALLPRQLVVHGRQGQVDLEVERVATRLRSLSDGLLAFSIVAIVVGALLVFNVFTATATQRAGELALMRAIGATRLQILGSALSESALIGLLGTVLGLIVAPVSALAMRLLLNPVSVGLPRQGLVVSAVAVLAGAGIGVGMSLVGALVPAVRGARRAPLEAMRGAAAPISRLRGRVARTVLAVVLTAGAVVLVLTVGGTRNERLRGGAVAGGLMLLAALVIGPLLVRWLVPVFAWPLERLRGIVPRLAREQILRNPGRAAVSGSSLAIGIALVLVLTIYASGLRSADATAIRQAFTGDLAIENADPSVPIPGSSVRAAADLPGLVGLSSLRVARARVGAGPTVTVSGLDPTTWTQVYRFHWVAGGPRSFAGLGAGDVLLEQDTARAAGLSVGRRTTLMTGGGVALPVTVAGIYRDPGLLRGAVVAADWFSGVFHQPRLQAVFVRLAPGTSARSALAVLRANLRSFPGVVARSQTALASASDSRVRSLVGLIYALLGLSVAMSLIGIAGTLGLSVHERTRELGILRAIGMTAEQARAVVRAESVLTAAIGVLSGVVLGLALGWAVTRALEPDGFAFTVPWLVLVPVVLGGVLAGVLAAWPPARRAGRIDILGAIAHE